MNRRGAIGTILCTFAAILGVNIVLRVIMRGPDAALHVSWAGIAIAAVIAVVAAVAEQDRRGKHAHGQP